MKTSTPWVVRRGATAVVALCVMTPRGQAPAAGAPDDGGAAVVVPRVQGLAVVPGVMSFRGPRPDPALCSPRAISDLLAWLPERRRETGQRAAVDALAEPGGRASSRRSTPDAVLRQAELGGPGSLATSFPSPAQPGHQQVPCARQASI